MLDAAGRVNPVNLLLVATRVRLHSHEEETRVVYRGFVSFRLFVVSMKDSEHSQGLAVVLLEPEIVPR